MSGIKNDSKMATSNIRIRKTCKWCGSEFDAQKTSTQFCCKRCAEHAYKERKRQERKQKAERDDKTDVHEGNIKNLDGLTIW